MTWMIFKIIFAWLCVLIVLGFAISFFTGCTYAVTMVHTEGEASDVIEAEQTATPDISPAVAFPRGIA